MPEKLKDTLIGIVLLLAAIGFYVEQFESIPDNAIVYVDVKTKTYYGEPTALDEIYLGHKLTKTTLRKALANNYKPDETSRNNGDFTGYSSSVIWWFFVKETGILPSLKRWNSDGTWNY